MELEHEAAPPCEKCWLAEQSRFLSRVSGKSIAGLALIAPARVMLAARNTDGVHTPFVLQHPREKKESPFLAIRRLIESLGSRLALWLGIRQRIAWHLH